MSMFEKRRADEPVSERDPVGTIPPDAGERRPVTRSRDTAAIGKTITITGDVVGEESLIIGGKVDGTVVLKNHELTVADSGLVTASVTASVVKIEGEVTGDIDGKDKVVVTKTGRVQGNIVAPRVTLEDGAKFKGSIDMDPGPGRETAAPKPLHAAPPPDQAGDDVARASGGSEPGR